MTEEAPTVVQSVHIKASRDRVWQALINPGFTARYYYGYAIDADSGEAGASYRYRHPDGSVAIVGQILEVEPGKRLVMTFSAQWDASLQGDSPSRVTYELEELAPELTKLTLVHDAFDGETATFTAVSGGWGLILDGLKTLLETGEPLRASA